MKSMADLERVRKEAQKKIELRQSDERKQVIVYMGTCGIAAGAREVVASIIEELEKYELSNVEVTQRGCIGLCEYEPLVEVRIPKEKAVMYGHIDDQKAKRIVLKHIMDGIVLDEWVVKGI